MSVTYSEIHKVCTKLSAKNGEKITTRRIREQLGHGSLSTISAHLQTWLSQNNVHRLPNSRYTKHTNTVQKCTELPVQKCTGGSVQQSCTELPVQQSCTELSVQNPSPSIEQKAVIENSPDITSHASISRWNHLASVLSHPEQIFLGLCSLILSTYLIQQNYNFFLVIETSRFSAISNAIISELLLIIVATSLAFASKKSHQFILSLFLLATISGLGVFLHRSLSEGFVSKSDQVAMIAQEKAVTNKAIETHQQSLDTLPANYIAKRQDLQSKIDLERKKISELNSRIENSYQNITSSHSGRLAYAFWLRLATMILNAYLVHCFFSRLRKTWLLPLNG